MRVATARAARRRGSSITILPRGASDFVGEQRQRHAGRLARAGRRLQHDVRVRGNGGPQRRQRRVDRQGELRILHSGIIGARQERLSRHRLDRRRFSYTAAPDQHELTIQGDFMKLARTRSCVCSLLLVLLTGVAVAADLPTARPESVGMSTQRLGRLKSEMQGARRPRPAARRRHHGREGRQGRAVRGAGKRDLESGAPMQKDSIFRIYSMTKPITGVAMMMLFEEGKWQLNDPVSKHIPEFANLKVAKVNPQNGTRHAGRAGSSDDDARADVAFRRAHLRRVRQHRGRQDVHGRQRARSRRSRCRR